MEEERDFFAELDARAEARRSGWPAPPVDDGPEQVEHDDFASAHAALRDFQVTLREVRLAMATRQGPATEAERGLRKPQANAPGAARLAQRKAGD